MGLAGSAACGGFASVACQGQEQTTKDFDYQSLPETQWVRLGAPTRKVPANITSYSGMCVDTKQQQLLLFGGGHSDYLGNEVWAWDIRKQTWNKLTEPTPREKYDKTKFDWDKFPEMFPDLKAPVSRHTYASVEFIEHAGLMFAAGTSTFSGPNEYLWHKVYVKDATGPLKDKGYSPFDAWVFKPDSKKWDYRRPPGADSQGVVMSAYAPDARLLVTIGKYGPVTYDVDKNVWTKKKPKNGPNTGVHQTFTYDVKRKVVYMVGGSGAETGKGTDQLWAYSLAKDEWQLFEPEGRRPRLHDGTGSAYDAHADLLVAYGKDSLWIYDPEKNAWQENPAKGGPQPQMLV